MPPSKTRTLMHLSIFTVEPVSNNQYHTIQNFGGRNFGKIAHCKNWRIIVWRIPKTSRKYKRPRKMKFQLSLCKNCLPKCFAMISPCNLFSHTISLVMISRGYWFYIIMCNTPVQAWSTGLVVITITRKLGMHLLVKFWVVKERWVIFMLPLQ